MRNRMNSQFHHTARRLAGTFLRILTILLITGSAAFAQEYDILIKGGHVMDARNGVNEVMDVAIQDGSVARVASSIPESSAERVIDATGKIVTPGLIDIHGHHFHGTVPNRYLSNSFTALPPDGFTFRAGVTTAVDVGGAGWRNFRLFKEQVIDRSQTRVLSFLNIVGEGMAGVVPDEQNVNDMDPKMTALVANQFRNDVVGVKVAHYSGHEWEPYQRAVEAGNLADIPVMVDFGGADPVLPLEDLFFDVLRPGDIYTHAYGGGMTGHGGRQSIIDPENDFQLRPRMLEAQEHGIIFDVGHGGGSFFYEYAVPATEQGLWPNTISTDLHTGSMNGGMKTMLNTVSNMMALGMPVYDAIAASTWNPAKVIQREDLGHLSEGAVADIAIFTLREGTFGFLDSRRNVIEADQKLETEVTIRAGRIVYDLNGLASPRWER
ncbi:MAG: amidohydrolase/deacetylase family metallohydrolase [Balneolaceae bacterium]